MFCQNDGFLIKTCFLKNLNAIDEELNFVTNTKLFRDEKLYITFAGSSFEKLPSEIFTAYENVQIVLMANCKVQEIEENSFQEAHSLKHLTLERNKISVLESSTFNGAENLEGLDLAFNEIENLPTGVFSKLIKLKELYLSGNKIKTVEQTTFSTLTQLSMLSLGSDLTVISPNLFSQNNDLTYLDLKRNQLADVYDSIKHLYKLEYLDLSGNLLTDLENYPEAVQYLYVTDNKLEKLFINQNVVKLRAAGNRIRELSVKSYEKLTEFYLDLDIMLKQFGEINKFPNLRLLGNETEPMFINMVVRSFLKSYVVLLEI